jgi:hypothetical protein
LPAGELVTNRSSPRAPQMARPVIKDADAPSTAAGPQRATRHMHHAPTRRSRKRPRTTSRQQRAEQERHVSDRVDERHPRGHAPRRRGTYPSSAGTPARQRRTSPRYDRAGSTPRSGSPPGRYSSITVRRPEKVAILATRRKTSDSSTTPASTRFWRKEIKVRRGRRRCCCCGTRRGGCC